MPFIHPLRPDHPLWTVERGGLHGADCYLYRVRGRGMFPLDLLRQEYAIPAGPMDTALIERSLTAGWSGGRLVVGLRGLRSPIPPRWHARGWQIMWRDGYRTPILRMLEDEEISVLDSELLLDDDNEPRG